MSIYHLEKFDDYLGCDMPVFSTEDREALLFVLFCNSKVAGDFNVCSDDLILYKNSEEIPVCSINPCIITELQFISMLN